jgi:hypothetical protein
MAEQQETVQTTAQKHKEDLSKARSVLASRRLKNAKEQQRHEETLLSTLPCSTAHLQYELETDEVDKVLRGRWPKIIQKQASALQSATDEERRAAMLRQRVVSGYEMLLEKTVHCSPTGIAMRVDPAQDVDMVHHGDGMSKELPNGIESTDTGVDAANSPAGMKMDCDAHTVDSDTVTAATTTTTSPPETMQQ